MNIGDRLDSTFSIFSFVFFFFFFQGVSGKQISLFIYCLRAIHGTIATLLRKKNIKNESHSTIHTFKNYFATVFFNFQQNKLYPNGSLVASIFLIQLLNLPKVPNNFLHMFLASLIIHLKVQWHKFNLCHFPKYFHCW